jgi:hypothetical protein
VGELQHGVIEASALQRLSGEGSVDADQEEAEGQARARREAYNV